MEGGLCRASVMSVMTRLGFSLSSDVNVCSSTITITVRTLIVIKIEIFDFRRETRERRNVVHSAYDYKISNCETQTQKTSVVPRIKRSDDTCTGRS